MNPNLMVFIQEITHQLSKCVQHRQKDEVYIINLDEYKSIGTHWIALMVIMPYTLIALELNTFQKKLKN